MEEFYNEIKKFLETNKNKENILEFVTTTLKLSLNNGFDDDIKSFIKDLIINSHKCDKYFKKNIKNEEIIELFLKEWEDKHLWKLVLFLKNIRLFYQFINKELVAEHFYLEGTKKDLFSVVFLYFYEEIEKFDLNKKLKFTTFMVSRLKFCMRNIDENFSKNISVGWHYKNKIISWYKMIYKFYSEEILNWDQPSIEKIQNNKEIQEYIKEKGFTKNMLDRNFLEQIIDRIFYNQNKLFNFNEDNWIWFEWWNERDWIEWELVETCNFLEEFNKLESEKWFFGTFINYLWTQWNKYLTSIIIICLMEEWFYDKYKEEVLKQIKGKEIIIAKKKYDEKFIIELFENNEWLTLEKVWKVFGLTKEVIRLWRNEFIRQLSSFILKKSEEQNMKRRDFLTII